MANIRFSKFVGPELTEIATTIAADHPEAANRFLASADQTFEMLAEQPYLGRTRQFSKSRLNGLRSFRVTGFADYLIFYEPVSDGIAVHHVLHGARNLPALFNDK